MGEEVRPPERSISEASYITEMSGKHTDLVPPYSAEDLRLSALVVMPGLNWPGTTLSIPI